MTVYTDNSARFAAQDRTVEADRRLTSAVRQARQIVARRHPGAREEAAVVLAQAERSASRILGRRAS